MKRVFCLQVKRKVDMQVNQTRSAIHFVSPQYLICRTSTDDQPVVVESLRLTHPNSGGVEGAPEWPAYRDAGAGPGSGH